MRSSVRLLARYFEPGAPTGLTGLRTHAAPRRALLATYNETLENLKAIPASSLYRQSIESVTKHRLALVEKMTPPGYDEWKTRMEEVQKRYPVVQFKFPEPEIDFRSKELEWDGNTGENIVDKREAWDAPKPRHPQQGDDDIPTEQARLADEAEIAVKRNEEAITQYRKELHEMMGKESVQLDALAFEELVKVREQTDKDGEEAFTEVVKIAPPPDLTSEQVTELENKIGGGLIEEVIELAEGELELVRTMVKNKVWEPLEEKPVEGQWTYFER